MNRVVLRVGGALCFGMALITFALRGLLTDSQVEKSRWIVARPWFLDFACFVVGTVFILVSLSKRGSDSKRRIFLPLLFLGIVFVFFRGALSAMMMRFVVVPSLDWQAVYLLYSVASIFFAFVGGALLVAARPPKFRNASLPYTKAK